LRQQFKKLKHGEYGLPPGKPCFFNLNVMEIKQFENNLIAFDLDSEIVNATDMAKRYGKRTVDFLKLDSTIAFIEALKSDVTLSNITNFEPVITVRGNFADGRSQGTWMYKLLAYKFAAWLNPEFEIFIYRVFDNFLNEKLRNQQRQLDYFWDKSDIKDLYK
jgi:hypothetical protein